MLERGSKAKDWLWKEEVLWIPKRKSHGGDDDDGEGGGREVIMERHCLETRVKRTKEGIGRWERIDSVTSWFRVLKVDDSISGLLSDIFVVDDFDFDLKIEEEEERQRESVKSAMVENV